MNVTEPHRALATKTSPSNPYQLSGTSLFARCPNVSLSVMTTPAHMPLYVSISSIIPHCFVIFSYCVFIRFLTNPPMHSRVSTLPLFLSPPPVLLLPPLLGPLPFPWPSILTRNIRTLIFTSADTNFIPRRSLCLRVKVSERSSPMNSRRRTGTTR
jgi:hypothetical protein